MKKTLIISIIGLMFLALLSASSYANVLGPCVNCHTMHSSQSPAPANWTARGWTAGTTNGALVVGGCFGCHSDIGTDSTIDLGGGTILPIVWNKSVPGAPLAGGNFYYRVDAATDNRIHNVSGITGQDSILASLTPPGWMQIAVGPQEATWSSQLTCAGTYGCHGDRTPGVTDQFQAVRGYHHATGATPYRFLNGITGVEDNDWEEEVAIDHNVYKGDTADNTATISYLCGQCHGVFHKHAGLGGTAAVGSASPWFRHPTDIALASSGGSSFTTDYGGVARPYSVETPVGFDDPSTITVPLTTFTASNARVLCLSCHRAHGSNNAQGDILRFEYNASIGAGSAANTGCLRCHQRQR